MSNNADTAFDLLSLTALEKLTAEDSIWDKHLDSKGRTEKTRHNYRQAAEQLAIYRRRLGLSTDVASIGVTDIEAFLVHIGNTRSDATKVTRYAQLKQLFWWLHNVMEWIDSNPMDRIKRPRMEERLVAVPPRDDVAKIIKLCEQGKSFDHRRDAAILRLFISTGARESELANVLMVDISQGAGSISVMGKGRVERDLPLSDKSRTALLKYLKARNAHPQAGRKELWLSAKGALTPSGFLQMVERRCKQAGVPRISVHQLRHAWAHDAKLKHVPGEVMMTLGGWKTRSMLDRYAKSAASERAIEAHAAFGLGDDI